jgi:hypothetical protein
MRLDTARPTAQKNVPIPRDRTDSAVCVVESNGAVDSSDHKSGLSRSFYAYMDHPRLKGAIRVHRGMNGGMMNVRVRGSPG